MLVRALLAGVLSLALGGYSLHAVAETVVIGGEGGRGGDGVINLYGSGTVIIIGSVGGAGGGGGSAGTPSPGPAPTGSISATFATRDNRDINGNDIVSAGASIDIGACAKLCGAMPSCVAFSYDRWNNRCFPKNKISGSVLDVRSTIGVKKPASLPNVSQNEAQMLAVRGKRFRGTSTPVAGGASTNDQCKSKCSTDLHCVGFTFTSSTCSAYKLINGWDLDGSATSGHKWQAVN